jgi:uncharacterized protein
VARGRRATAVGTALFEAGSVTRGALTLARQLDGPVETPVMIATGARPGRVLWVQAAIHGAEVGGTIGIACCLNRLDLGSMSGAIVGIMAANPLAFRDQSRATPQDGENMNRVFPGAAGGTITRQMAHRLMTVAEETADAVMDLHSGGIADIVPFYSLYWEDGSKPSQKAAELARSAATDTVWSASDAWLSGAMFTQLTKRGVPAIIIECGGAEVTDEQIENFARAIEGVARALEILPGGPMPQERYHAIGSCDLVFTGEGGFFVPHCAAGDTLEAGSVVGRVIDVFGAEKEVITTPKRAFLAAIGRRYLPVHSGTMIAELNDDLGWSKARSVGIKTKTPRAVARKPPASKRKGRLVAEGKAGGDLPAMVGALGVGARR